MIKINEHFSCFTGTWMVVGQNHHHFIPWKWYFSWKFCIHVSLYIFTNFCRSELRRVLLWIQVLGIDMNRIPFKIVKILG